jgi:hypothetical protein
MGLPPILPVAQNGARRESVSHVIREAGDGLSGCTRVIPRQRIALWFGGGLMVAMSFLPPIAYYEDDGQGGWRPHSIRYGFVLAPPPPTDPVPETFRFRVAWELLALQWAVLAGLTLGTILALREGRGRLRLARARRSAVAGDVRRGRRRSSG